MAVSKEDLGDLFTVVVEQLASRISEGMWSSGDMAVAVKLLKDNNISCTEEESTALADLRAALASKKSRRHGSALEDLRDIAQDEINRDTWSH